MSYVCMYIQYVDVYIYFVLLIHPTIPYMHFPHVITWRKDNCFLHRERGDIILPPGNGLNRQKNVIYKLLHSYQCQKKLLFLLSHNFRILFYDKTSQKN
jgi:hypothetical protein